MADKFGAYIQKLMTTVLDKEQEQFVIDLAYDELKRINADVQEFLIKNEPISEEDESKEEVEKQLLQEDKENVKDK